MVTQIMDNIESLAIQPNIFYTAEEAANLLRVSRETMLQLLKSNRPSGVKIGRQWRVLGAALLDLSSGERETEAAHINDWLNASTSSLTEVWDNEEDAVYDNL